MSQCDICEEMGNANNCKHCSLGNPCLGCSDYDERNDVCISNGGCGQNLEQSAN